jgi:hypothetical protein
VKEEEEEMMMIRSAVAVVMTVLSLCLLAACGEEADLPPLTSAKTDPAADAPVGSIVTTSEGQEKIVTQTGLPCDVDAILRNRCQTCHSSPTKYGASVPLVTVDDLQKAKDLGSASTTPRSRCRRARSPVSMRRSWRCSTAFSRAARKRPT